MRSKHDYSKLWALQDCGNGEFSRRTGINFAAVRDRKELSMPTICVAAYKLGCKISDLVDMEEICE